MRAGCFASEASGCPVESRLPPGREFRDYVWEKLRGRRPPSETWKSVRVDGGERARLIRGAEGEDGRRVTACAGSLRDRKASPLLSFLSCGNSGLF